MEAQCPTFSPAAIGLARNHVRSRVTIAAATLIVQICVGVFAHFFTLDSPMLHGLGSVLRDWDWQDALACVMPLIVGVILGGFCQAVCGPRVTASIGGILCGSGVLFQSAYPLFLKLNHEPSLPAPHAFYWLIATGAAGIGMAYISSVVMLVKWFPERRGLMAGLALTGCFVGALLGPAFSTLESTSVAGVYSGLIYIVVAIIAAQFFVNPTAASRPKGQGAGRIMAAARLCGLWSVLFLGCGIGNVLIVRLWHNAEAIRRALEFSPYRTLGPAMAIGMIAIAALGGAFLGWLADKLGRAKTYSLLFAALAGIALFLPDTPPAMILLVAGAAVAACYTGAFHVVLVSAADFFGTEYLGAIYGFLLTAAVAGVLVTASNFQTIVIAAAVVAACTVMTALVLRTRRLGNDVMCQTD